MKKDVSARSRPRFWFGRPGSTLLTGVLTLLPLTITLAVVIWCAGLLLRLIGPESVIGMLLSEIGLALTGSTLVSYLLGGLVALGLVYGLGLVVETRIAADLPEIIGRSVRRLPIIGQIHEFASQFVGMLRPDGKVDVATMAPVWVAFGGGEAVVLGLMPTEAPVRIGDEEKVGVLVPMAPVPFGGGLVFVPRNWVRPAALSVDQLTSIYVSMGLTAPDVTRSNA